MKINVLIIWKACCLRRLWLCGQHAEMLTILFCLISSSFIPSAVRMWNSLQLESHTIDYAIDKLKWKCNNVFDEAIRSNNVKHAQLGMNCSKLNAHLILLHVSDIAQCLIQLVWLSCSGYRTGFNALCTLPSIWLLQTCMLNTPLYWIAAFNVTCSHIYLMYIHSMQHDQIVQNVI